MLRTLAFVALRLLVIATCMAVLTAVAVAIGEFVLPKPTSPSDWGFGRLGVELGIGMVAGLVVGIPLAVRLGRRRFDGPSRVLQTMAALVIPPLIMVGSCMERSHGADPNLTVLPAEDMLAPPTSTGDAAPQPPPDPIPARLTPPGRGADR